MGRCHSKKKDPPKPQEKPLFVSINVEITVPIRPPLVRKTKTTIARTNFSEVFVNVIDDIRAKFHELPKLSNDMGDYVIVLEGKNSNPLFLMDVLNEDDMLRLTSRKEPKPIFRFRIPQQRKTEGINGFEKLKSIKEE